MSTGIRRAIYFSKRKDKDILDFIEPMMERYDFSEIIRELVRDGIKYRVGQPEKVLQSNTPPTSSPQININLKAKVVKDEDLESRLDNF
jgi:hypothetical protein